MYRSIKPKYFRNSLIVCTKFKIFPLSRYEEYFDALAKCKFRRKNLNIDICEIDNLFFIESLYNIAVTIFDK